MEQLSNNWTRICIIGEMESVVIISYTCFSQPLIKVIGRVLEIEHSFFSLYLNPRQQIGVDICDAITQSDLQSHTSLSLLDE